MILPRRQTEHHRSVTHPRRLSFAVGTSLLTLSASLAIGCKPKIVNEGPQEPVHVNEGPADPPTEEPSDEQPDAEAPDAESPTDDPSVDGPSTVNTRPPDDR
jgi:hypothetical protein